MSIDAKLQTEIQRAVDAALDARIGEMKGDPAPAQAHAIQPVVRVVARAVEVLGTSEKALRWINNPVPSLNYRTPLSMLDSPEGLMSVEDALGRIEHGVW
jgi:putative toxin-antitoxin system antitoxin component (TIGR02293 family)